MDFDAAFGRLDLTAAARSVPPHVSPEDLDDQHALRDLVVAVLAPQISVVSRAAPYFRFSAQDDPWLDVNLRAARMAQELMRGAAPATFVQVDLDGLLAGALAHAAARYPTPSRRAASPSYRSQAWKPSTPTIPSWQRS